MPEKRVDEYLTAMEKEIDYVSESFKDKILDTVYIGGGTPTTLEPDELRRLLSYLKNKFDRLFFKKCLIFSNIYIIIAMQIKHLH